MIANGPAACNKHGADRTLGPTIQNLWILPDFESYVCAKRFARTIDTSQLSIRPLPPVAPSNLSAFLQSQEPASLCLAQCNHPTTVDSYLNSPSSWMLSRLRPLNATNDRAQLQILRSHHGRARGDTVSTYCRWTRPRRQCFLNRLVGSAKRSEELSGKSLVTRCASLLQLQYTHSSRLWHVAML